jgi:hypothetical protein
MSDEDFEDILKIMENDYDFPSMLVVVFGDFILLLLKTWKS